MAKGGYTGKVLIAARHGGYQYVPAKSVDRRLWEPVRRKIKVGRGVARRRRFWVRKRTRPVEYVRQWIFRIESDTAYFTEDVVEVVDEPYDISLDQMSSNLVDPARLRRMEGYLIGEHGGKSTRGGIRWSVPRDLSSGKGGARRLTVGQARGVLRGLRLEDLRRVGGK